jgi:hypothetical protein
VRVLDGSSRLEGLVVRRRVVRSKGDVVLGVEVLGCNLDDEWQREKIVDDMDNVASSINCKSSMLRLSAFELRPSFVQILPVGRSPLGRRQ